jgi:hypothetical protein
MSIGHPLQKTDGGKPIHFMADNFHAFTAGNQFCDWQRQQASRYRLVAENGILQLICFNCSRKLFFSPLSTEHWQAYFRY